MTDIYCSNSNFDIKNSGLPTWRVLFNTPNRSSDLIENYEKEIWKDIVGYENMYKISSFGRVLSNRIDKNWKLLKISYHKGYCKVSLTNKNKYSKSFAIHRLVAEAFILNNEQKPFVNHKDGVKWNNKIDNLEWVTPSENTIHSVNVLNNKSKPNGITVYQYTFDGTLIDIFSSVNQAAVKNKTTTSNISHVCRRMSNYYKGFIYSYKRLEKSYFINFNNNSGGNRKPISKYIDGELVKKYNNKKEACKDNNMVYQTLDRLLEGKTSKKIATNITFKSN